MTVTKGTTLPSGEDPLPLCSCRDKTSSKDIQHTMKEYYGRNRPVTPQISATS